MEYPIIDTLTNAYIRNGWTGLNISNGKNLCNINNYISYYNTPYNFYIESGILHITGTTLMGFIIPVELNTYTWSFDSTATGGAYRIRTYSAYPVDFVTNYISQPVNNSITQLHTSYVFNNTDINAKFVLLTFYSSSVQTKDISNIQFELGESETPYEPYKQPASDIFSRTRLPLIRYFPHPVIDSLQRASDGTMMVDDVQVLRHYLTKFGIGNIELVRFHAINPNASDDIREIDLEPIQIDVPIKEKKTGEEDLNVKTE